MGLCGAGAAEVLSAVLPKTKSLFWAYKKGQIRISSPPGLHGRCAGQIVSYEYSTRLVYWDRYL
jgi:hypothetical protein